MLGSMVNRSKHPLSALGFVESKSNLLCKKPLLGSWCVWALLGTAKYRMGPYGHVLEWNDFTTHQNNRSFAISGFFSVGLCNSASSSRKNMITRNHLPIAGHSAKLIHFSVIYKSFKSN